MKRADDAPISEFMLRQFAKDRSVITVYGGGPYPVFARGDRRSAATHWVTRATVQALKDSGDLVPVPRGLALSEVARSRLLGSKPAY